MSYLAFPLENVHDLLGIDVEANVEHLVIHAGQRMG
jgi:hypothetical protein